MNANASRQELPVALITGGSSGIGLACARILSQRGYQVIIAARDRTRLLDVAASSAQDHSSRIETIVLNVDDETACGIAVEAAYARYGRLDWLVTSAGIVEPGLFLDVDIESHRRQMQTNYFGTLAVVRSAAKIMREQGSGRITLISSAAAFVGVVGYSGYAPGKFAIRGLGEVLRIELAQYGISVSVAFPPDTDTPQLTRENLTKPTATRLITAGGGVWPADTIAARIISQAERGDFMLTPTLLMCAFGLLHSLYAPVFRLRQQRVLRRLRKAEKH